MKDQAHWIKCTHIYNLFIYSQYNYNISIEIYAFALIVHVHFYILNCTFNETGIVSQ